MHIRFMQDDFYAMITENSSSAFDPIRDFVNDVLQGEVEPIAYMMEADNPNVHPAIAKTFTPLYDALFSKVKITGSDFELKFSPLHFVTEAQTLDHISFSIIVSGGRKLPEMAKHDFFSSNIRDTLYAETPNWIAIGWPKYETKDCFIIKAEFYCWKTDIRKDMLAMDKRRLLAVPRDMARPMSNNEYFAKKLKYGF